MKYVIGFLKTTIVGGALYLIPIVVIVVVLGKLHSVVATHLMPLVDALELRAIGGIHAARILAVVALLLLCFAAGLIARTGVAQRFVAWLERVILSNLPGYSMMSALAHEAAGEAREGSEMRPVLARIEDAWQIALMVERVDADLVAVFVPGAPDPKSGSVYLMTNDRLKPLDVSISEVMKCLKGLGLGARALLAGRT